MNLLFTALLSEGSIIDIDGTIFVQFGIFAIAFLLFRPLIFKPMVAVFEARDQATHGAKLEAQRLQDEAAAESEEFYEEMRRVRLQAGEERDRLRNEGKKLERAVLDKVRDETNKQLADADARLAIEAARLRAELQRDVPMLAQDIAKKFLHRELR